MQFYPYKTQDGQGIDLGDVHERNRGPQNDTCRAANRYLKRSRGLHSFAVLAEIMQMLLFCGSLMAQGTPTQIRSAVARATEAVSAEMQIGVDPAIIEEMAASATIFGGNFCYAQSQAEADAKCRATLFNESVLRRHVRGFLADAQSAAPNVMSLGARLARESGGDFSLIGWPSLVPNQIGVVELAERAPAQVYLSTSTGPVQIANSANRVLLSAGRHQLSVRPDGRMAVAGVVTVSARTRVSFGGQPSVAQAGPVGRLDAPSEAFCYERTEFKFEGPLAFFNWGRARFAESGDTYLASVGRQYGVDVRVEDGLGECGADCREAMGIVFAQAIAVWRTGCARCNANALAVVRVEEHVWLDARIANRLRLLSSGSPVSLDLAQRRGDESGRTISAPSLSVPQTAVVGYEQLSSDPALRNSVCRLTDGAAPWVATGKHLACGGSSAGTAVVTPLVRLMNTSTSCGPGIHFLACGIPNAGIELATGSTRFALRGSRGNFSIGRSSDGLEVSMQDVILHEVGHWFGVPHPDQVGVAGWPDIMASTLGDGKACVSAASLTMMNNAMDARWSWRVNEGRGLRRPAARPQPIPASGVPIQVPRSR